VTAAREDILKKLTHRIPLALIGDPELAKKILAVAEAAGPDRDVSVWMMPDAAVAILVHDGADPSPDYLWEHVRRHLSGDELDRLTTEGDA